MAGNIIPAIATTNAVIAGLIVLEGLKILSGELESCRTVGQLVWNFSATKTSVCLDEPALMSALQIFLNKCPNLRKKLLVPCVLDPPSASCYVCASKPEVTVKVNVEKATVLCLQDRVRPYSCDAEHLHVSRHTVVLSVQILKERFGMVAPDVQIEDGKGTILISSEEGETEGEDSAEGHQTIGMLCFTLPAPASTANNSKFLADFGIRNGSRLQADDFLQDYTLLLNVLHAYVSSGFTALSFGDEHPVRLSVSAAGRTWSGTWSLRW